MFSRHVLKHIPGVRSHVELYCNDQSFRDLNGVAESRRSGDRHLEADVRQLMARANETGRMLSGLIKSLNRHATAESAA
jgi:hypothetical protein